MASIQCAKCKGVHASVAEVRQCHSVAAPPEFVAPSVDNSYVVGSSSPKIYLNVAYSEKDTVKARGASWDGTARKWWITKEVWDLNPEFWKTYEDTGKNQAAPEGWYRVGEDIYKVVMNQAGTRTYASILVVEENEEGQKRGRWALASGMINKLTVADLMTLDNQCEFGKLYGFCVRCGKPLTKEESQKRGMGDKCAGKAGI